MTLEEFRNKFREAAEAQRIPAMHYCLHKNEDGSDSLIIEPNKGSCRCTICGAVFSSNNLTGPALNEAKFDELYTNMNEVFNYTKLRADTSKESLDAIERMIFCLDVLRYYFNSFKDSAAIIDKKFYGSDFNKLKADNKIPNIPKAKNPRELFGDMQNLPGFGPSLYGAPYAYAGPMYNPFSPNGVINGLNPVYNPMFTPVPPAGEPHVPHPSTTPNPIMENQTNLSPEDNKLMDELFKDDYMSKDVKPCPFDTDTNT